MRRFALASIVALTVVVPVQLSAQDRGFPFDSELLLDARPMKGSKQMPSVDIGPKGQASIKLWCNTVAGQFVVADNTVTILTGQKTARTCPPDRMQGDEEMLQALEQVTSWRRSGSIVTFEGEGAKPMRFRIPTN